MEIKNLGQFIQHLATKAGVQLDDKNLINILSNSELTKITVNSDLVKAMDENLLSVDDATNNHPLIGSKYKAQALNALDKRVLELASELTLSDDELEELKKPINSYKKLEFVIGKLKEAKPAKGDKGDKDALQKQVDDLLKKLQDKDKEHADALQKASDERIADKVGFEKHSNYGKLKTIYDELPESIRESSIDSVIKNALQEKGAEFAYDEKGAFIIRQKDGANLVGANHKAYTPQSFIDEILAQNKILKVAETPKGGEQQPGQQVVIPGGQQPEINGTNQSIADFNMSQLQQAGESS